MQCRRPRAEFADPLIVSAEVFERGICTAEESRGLRVVQTLVEAFERFLDDLTHAFARDPDLARDLLERQGFGTVETETQSQDLCFAIVDRLHETTQDPEFFLTQ